MTTTTDPTLANMASRVYAVNEANGWFDEDRAFGDDLALLHSEVSEMFEAYRAHEFEDVTKVPAYDRAAGEEPKLPKPEGFGSEAADVLVRLLDTDYRHGVDFRWKTLEDVDYCHDFNPKATVGEHIQNLHKLIAMIGFTHDLEKVLSYLKTWCDHLEIDLQAEFERKLAFNATRGYRHGGKRV